jgi:hypothetical protein
MEQPIDPGRCRINNRTRIFGAVIQSGCSSSFSGFDFYIACRSITGTEAIIMKIITPIHCTGNCSYCEIGILCNHAGSPIKKTGGNKMSNVISHEWGKYHYGDMSVIRP